MTPSTESQDGLVESWSSRVDRLDTSVFDHIESGGLSLSDRRSLLAVHAALAARGDFSYLEVGSYHGASLQSFIADARCREIVSIDRRDGSSPDTRSMEPEYPGNTTARMLECLTGVPGADFAKLSTMEASTEELDAGQFRADLCFIDAQHTDDAALRDADFCRRVIRDRGVIVFHDRLVVDGGILQFLGQLRRYRAYPLSHELFVVEVGVATLLRDPRVRAQVPNPVWLWVAHLGAVRAALQLGPAVRNLRRFFARSVLTVGAPRRSWRTPAATQVAPQPWFEIHTFVDDDARYERMRRSFIEAGFSPDAFVRLTAGADEPYATITRIGRRSQASYPILCHQDLVADRGAGAADLLEELRRLDAADSHWIVAGAAGVMRSGRLLKGLVDPDGGPTGEALPLPVVTLDECFLVFNPRHVARCSQDVSGFHFYGADVCLHALRSGGTAYVLGFPLTHGGRSHRRPELRPGYRQDYERARESFIAAWSERCLFSYVITTRDAVFLSRSRSLRRLFGSPGIMVSVARRRLNAADRPLRVVDRMSAPQLLYRRR